MGSVYKHRDGGLQACANVGGRRKKKNFAATNKKQAWSWIHEMEKALAKPTKPLLGGPRKVTLGALLHRYAELYTFSKKSRTSELSRINRYLVACGLPRHIPTSIWVHRPCSLEEPLAVFASGIAEAEGSVNGASARLRAGRLIGTSRDFGLVLEKS